MPKIKNNIRDKEYLIELVHNRPAIWDKNSDVYKDKQLKTVAWRAICTLLNDNFKQMDEKESREYVRSVIKIWAQTRDSWMRSQHGKKKGTAQRPYIYHKQLLFLQSVVSIDTKETTREEKRTNIGEEIEIKEESVDCDTASEEEVYFVTNSPTHEEDSADISVKRKIDEDNEYFGYKNVELVDVDEKKRRLDEIDEQIASYMRRKMSNSRTQEDRHMAFFRSIQPSLSLLNDDQILEFQAGVIGLLQNIKKGRTVN